MSLEVALKNNTIKRLFLTINNISNNYSYLEAEFLKGNFNNVISFLKSKKQLTNEELYYYCSSLDLLNKKELIDKYYYDNAENFNLKDDLFLKYLYLRFCSPDNSYVLRNKIMESKFDVPTRILHMLVGRDYFDSGNYEIAFEIWSKSNDTLLVNQTSIFNSIVKDIPANNSYIIKYIDELIDVNFDYLALNTIRVYLRSLILNKYYDLFYEIYNKYIPILIKFNFIPNVKFYSMYYMASYYYAKDDSKCLVFLKKCEKTTSLKNAKSLMLKVYELYFYYYKHVANNDLLALKYETKMASD